MPPRIGDALAALGETRPGAPRPDIPGIALPEIAWDLAGDLPVRMDSPPYSLAVLPSSRPPPAAHGFGAWDERCAGALAASLAVVAAEVVRQAAAGCADLAALLADAWNANTALLGGAARRARDQAEGEGLRAQVAAARDAQAAAVAASEALRAELAALTRHVEARLRVLSWQFAGRMVEQLERTAVAAALQDHAAKLRGRGGPSN
ncbi:hypothetical protein F751_5798 [Auxenochlorella protothecoides]|uniref:Uncharacterized protein n=1 Tax=Auxenochlorella protothecoides TaxID=3075 RepID=A0A087SUF6_AUXPR|nr:hypothetical protein F751_5798 [Auxenochlorella protothecoides]KFM29360.1 hypothetical protein F751_5798 [Auxenochlorella protothecoides]